MGAMLCCLTCGICGSCGSCEEKDNWTITDEIREGELGAGYLYKRGKNEIVPVWSNRYFTVTDYKLTYFLELDRSLYKGEIVLAGSRAAISAARNNQRSAWYFTVSHPQCGSRELCAKSQSRQQQWIDLINEVSAKLSKKGVVYGKLLKQGGLRKNTWQERWCIVVGQGAAGSIDYFEFAADNQPKGSIEILNATIRQFTKKEKHCFEISTAFTKKGKKADKKYVFACGDPDEARRWVGALETAALPYFATDDEEGQSPVVLNNMNSPDGGGPDWIAEAQSITNPIHQGQQQGYSSEDEWSNISRSISSSSVMSVGSMNSGSLMQSFSLPNPPSDKGVSGYLMKKSPNALVGWQRRFFKLTKRGDLVYFKMESSKEPLGVILIKDIISDQDLEVEPNTFILRIKTTGKEYVLKASSHDEGKMWAEALEVFLFKTRESLCSSTKSQTDDDD
jgi:hypothetical protein